MYFKACGLLLRAASIIAFSFFSADEACSKHEPSIETAFSTQEYDFLTRGGQYINASQFAFKTLSKKSSFVKSSMPTLVIASGDSLIIFKNSGLLITFLEKDPGKLKSLLSNLGNVLQESIPFPRCI